MLALHHAREAGLYWTGDQLAAIPDGAARPVRDEVRASGLCPVSGSYAWPVAWQDLVDRTDRAPLRALLQTFTERPDGLLVAISIIETSYDWWGLMVLDAEGARAEADLLDEVLLETLKHQDLDTLRSMLEHFYRGYRHGIDRPGPARRR